MITKGSEVAAMALETHKPGINKGTALVLEILPAIFGIFGIGWLYSGKTSTGLILLVSGFVFIWGGYAAIIIGSTVLTAVTLGLGVFGYCLACIVPFVQLIVGVGSTIMLNNDLSQE
jgi:hypothetical protein